MEEVIKLGDVENKIIEIRRQKVILDSDVALLYGVETRDINKAVKNNPEKFPAEYIIELTKTELEDLRWKFSTTKLSKTRAFPKAFTERGLYMLATILKGTKATKTTLAIVDTFAKIKELTRNIKALSDVKDNKNKKNMLQKSGELIAEILENDLALNETETTFEINFAVLKFKHTIKKKNEKN